MPAEFREKEVSEPAQDVSELFRFVVKYRSVVADAGISWGTSVFAIFIVNNDHHLPRAHGRNSISDTRTRPCTLDGLFDYVKPPAHMGGVSERVPA
jgi:hypothetical protein